MINSVDRKLFSQITQPRHVYIIASPSKDFNTLPYDIRKRQHYYQLPHVEMNIHSIKTVLSIVVYLTFSESLQ